MENIFFLYAYNHQGRKNVAIHSHTATEFIWMLNGQATVKIKQQEYIIEPGKLLIIAPENNHDQQCHGNVRNQFMLFMADTSVFNSETRLIDLKENLWFGKLFNDITEFHLESRSELCKDILCVMLKYLKKIEQGLHLKQVPMHPQLEKAIYIMQQHFSETLDIGDIARLAGVSKSYLRMLFARYIEQSPSKYLQELRMNHARILLQNPYLNIAEIANACGFNDASYFGRQFHKCNKISPHKYRLMIESQVY